MDETEMAALLGRSLTPIETTNFDLYLNIAEEALESLICTPVEEVTETRVFDLREGYRTAFVDIFWNVDEVKVNDTVIEPSDYSLRQWSKRNADWYNSLVFNCAFDDCQDEIEVTADWGFEPVSSGSSLPADLQYVLAGLFSQITKKNKFDPTIASKQVEDFRISFNVMADLDAEFYRAYSNILSKYSLCDIANIQHGAVRC